MAEAKPGTAVPFRKRTSGDAWFVYKTLNPAAAHDPMASFVAGYERAYRDSISDQTDFVQLREMLRRLLDVLEVLAIERDAVRSLAKFDQDRQETEA